MEGFGTSGDSLELLACLSDAKTWFFELYFQSLRSLFADKKVYEKILKNSRVATSQTRRWAPDKERKGNKERQKAV